MRLPAITVVSLLLAFAFQAHAEIVGKAGRFGGITIRYKVILPNNYDPSRAYPAVLAFAGGGQNLDGVNGMPDRNWREAETRAYIVVSPAAPSNNLFFERGGDRDLSRFSRSDIARLQGRTREISCCRSIQWRSQRVPYRIDVSAVLPIRDWFPRLSL